ncbi:MAG: hypothetical protein E3J26_03750 [Candidatus Zixiibacteriota bacterium]|nr:MAG: hypothetical protein E3J26_03750 [candidate division Zixibacteria bacterium]
MSNIKLMALALTALALLLAGCERDITGDVELADNSSTSCFTCHSDQEIGLTVAREQYENSVHADGENTNRNRLYNTRYESCEKCHSHEGFIAEVTGVEATGDNFSPITCFTCHKPHSLRNLEPRVTEAVVLEDGISIFDLGPANLCASCHHSRQNVSTYVVDSVKLSSHFGPHYSNQGDMLIGANAYEFADYDEYTNSWHSTGVTNGCVGCHMSKSMHESIGGHSWNMENEDRHFVNLSGCNQSGQNGESVCHVSPSLDSLNRVAHADFDGDSDVEGVHDEIEGLLDDLKALLIAAGLTNAEGTPLSVTVPDADSAGALYNFLFVEDDHSHGIHNTKYAVGLLQSSINYMTTGDPNGAPATNRSTERLVSAH